MWKLLSPFVAVVLIESIDYLRTERQIRSIPRFSVVEATQSDEKMHCAEMRSTDAEKKNHLNGRTVNINDKVCSVMNSQISTLSE
jgi:hypothetical protein